jgi:FecR protein
MSDYLFDGRGPEDPEVARLERALGTFRSRPSQALPALPPRIRPRRWPLAVAAATLLGVTFLLARSDPWDPAALRVSPYRLAEISGHVAVEDKSGCALDIAREDPALPPGAAIRVAKHGSAKLRIHRAGSVTLEENSQLRIDSAPGHGEDSGYLVHLDRGTMRASIFAAPRLFQVGTPAGIAVDLGCIYTATVLDDGATRLAVESGAVSFESDGRKVHVPSGAECVASPGRGPSVPVWSDDPPARNATLLALDTARDPSGEQIAAAFESTDSRASLTYFHLLDHPSEAVRQEAVAKLETIIGNRTRLDRAALLRGDLTARDDLRSRLESDW